MTQRIPTLQWGRKNRWQDFIRAEVGDGHEYRIFPIERYGYELWLTHPNTLDPAEFLGWFPTEQDAKKTASDHAGDS